MLKTVLARIADAGRQYREGRIAQERAREEAYLSEAQTLTERPPACPAPWRGALQLRRCPSDKVNAMPSIHSLVASAACNWFVVPVYNPGSRVNHVVRGTLRKLDGRVVRQEGKDVLVDWPRYGQAFVPAKELATISD